jgi:hypothetical protein
MVKETCRRVAFRSIIGQMGEPIPEGIHNDGQLPSATC